MAGYNPKSWDAFLKQSPEEYRLSGPSYAAYQRLNNNDIVQSDEQLSESDYEDIERYGDQASSVRTAQSSYVDPKTGETVMLGGPRKIRTYNKQDLAKARAQGSDYRADAASKRKLAEEAATAERENAAAEREMQRRLAFERGKAEIQSATPAGKVQLAQADLLGAQIGAEKSKYAPVDMQETLGLNPRYKQQFDALRNSGIPDRQAIGMVKMKELEDKQRLALEAATLSNERMTPRMRRMKQQQLEAQYGPIADSGISVTGQDTPVIDAIMQDPVLAAKLAEVEQIGAGIAGKRQKQKSSWFSSSAPESWDPLYQGIGQLVRDVAAATGYPEAEVFKAISARAGMRRGQTGFTITPDEQALIMGSL